MDSLIKELEDKGKKKKQTPNSKLGLLNTREKFLKAEKRDLRESKTELKHG